MKKKIIEQALSKLTKKEIKALGLNKKQKKKFTNYQFNIKYMIGDDNGFKTFKTIISKENPFIKTISQALQCLTPPEGHWGISLNDNTYEDNFKKGYISKEQYDHLMAIENSFDESHLLNFFKTYCTLEANDNDLFSKYEDYIFEINENFYMNGEESFYTYRKNTLKKKNK